MSRMDTFIYYLLRNWVSLLDQEIVYEKKNKCYELILNIVMKQIAIRKSQNKVKKYNVIIVGGMRGVTMSRLWYILKITKF